MTARTRCLILAVTLILLVGCDQASKDYAVDHLQQTTDDPLPFLGQTFLIKFAWNEGAFLSLFANLSDKARFVLLVLMNGLILGGLALALVLRTGWDKWSFTALALLLAGGIGNLIDRIWLGAVIDFMVIDLSGLTGIGWLKTGVFNVADIAITTGFLMLLPRLFGKEPPAPETTAEAAA